jgi:hypothetical protein
VCADVGDLIDLGHDSLRIDEERDPLREVGILLVRTFFGAVQATDRAVDIAQQREVEALLLAELEVLRRCVETGAEDLGAGLGERWASITEALTFTRSARRRGLGVPPEHDPGALLVLEVDGVARFVGQREVRGDVSCRNHQLATSIRPAHVAYSAA